MAIKLCVNDCSLHLLPLSLLLTELLLKQRVHRTLWSRPWAGAARPTVCKAVVHTHILAVFSSAAQPSALCFRARAAAPPVAQA